MRKIIIITFIIFITVITIINPVLAQTVSLGISPPIVEIVVMPGKSLLIAYNVENYGDPVILEATIKSFEPKDSFGNINILNDLNGPIRFSLDNSDLQLEQPFLVKTKATQQLLLRIRVPEGAPEGDYYYTVLAKSQPSNLSDQSTQAAASATIGSNILITVSNNGKIDVNGKITSFDVVPRFLLNLFQNQIRIFDSTDNIPVILRVQNNGQNLFKPEGEINLIGNFGEKATFDIIPQNVLGNSSRVLVASSEAAFNNENRSSLLLKGFFIGKYKLSTSLSFGQGLPNTYAAVTFYAIPIKLGFGLLVAFGVGIFLIKRFKNQDK